MSKNTQRRTIHEAELYLHYIKECYPGFLHIQSLKIQSRREGPQRYRLNAGVCPPWLTLPELERYLQGVFAALSFVGGPNA